MLVLEVVLILMINDITEYQLHDEGMQKMRPYRKLSLLNKQEIEKYIQKKWRNNRLQSILCLHI